MRARTKTATLNLRIDPKLKALAEQAASNDRRSLTSLVEKLLTDHIKHSGTEIRDKAAAILVGAGAVTADKIDRAKALSLIEVDPADYDWDETVERQS